MRTVVTNICNSLMAASISNSLQKTGDFAVRSIGAGGDDMIAACAADSADIVLLEVAYNPGFTIDKRLYEARMLRKQLPSCKVLLMCDENSAPELARKVAQAKRDRLTDDFIYSSVSESYLIAMLDAM